MRAGVLGALLLAGCASPPIEGSAEQLWGTDEVLELELELLAGSRQALFDEPREYAPVRVRLDGGSLVAGLRLKGRGSFRALDSGEKSAFKLDFDRYGGRFFGQAGVSLNSMISDDTWLAEALTYRAFGALDLPTLRSRHAHVTLDGEPWGVMLILEDADADSLDRTFGDAGGTLYEGTFALVDGERRAADFTADGVERFEVDEAGWPGGRQDLWALTEALDAAEALPEPDRTDAVRAALEAAVDVDAFLRFAAAEMATVHWDGYVGTPNNFRLYGDPSDGRLRFAPWGCDGALRFPALLQPDGFHRNGHHPGRLFDALLRDPELDARLRAELVDVADGFEAAGLAAALDARAEALAPWIDGEPWGGQRPEPWGVVRDRMRSLLEARPAALREDLAGG